MAKMKEIKNRINGVKDTKKITNAMYLISSTKMRKAKKELDLTRPYFDAVKTEISRIFSIHPDVENKYFCDKKEAVTNGTCGYLVITADKGLAGAYNTNVIKAVSKEMKKHAGNKIYVVGEYGRRYFAKHDIEVEKNFDYTAQNPTLDRARLIAGTLLAAYESGEVNEIMIVYTDHKSSMEEEVCLLPILPLGAEKFVWEGEDAPEPVSSDDIEAGFSPYEFRPDISKVLSSIVPNYIIGVVFGALIDSFCSEQNARMTAMEAANRNAEELIAGLSIEFNHARQGAITQEITEISAGAKAMRKKKKKAN